MATAAAHRRLGRLERAALQGVMVREIVNFSSFWRSSTFSSTVDPTIYLLAFGFGFGSLVSRVGGFRYVEFVGTGTVATGRPSDLIAEHAGREVVEVYGPPDKLREVEAAARQGGMSTRRTGTSVAVMRLEDASNGGPPDGERRPANLEDVFVLLTGEEIS